MTSKRQADERRRQIDLLLRREHLIQKQLEQKQRECQQLHQQIDDALPHLRWANLPGHQFSAPMIALCCSLASIVGFRAAPAVLSLFNDALGLGLKVPSRDAIRNWTCRAGVAMLQHEKADDWIWMIDHSVQIGKMQVLVVLGIRQSKLPYRQDSSSRTIKREDLEVLAVLPSSSKSKEQVIAELKPLSESLGTPLAVVCDGASELKAAVESLQNSHHAGETLGDASTPSGPAHLVDVKHKIASGLKKLLAGDKVFEDFSKRTSRCAAKIRQTELDHLVPPTRKDKCRFMNIHREIRWAAMVLSQLDRRANCKEPSSERLREKLGWVADFRESIEHWRQWCELIAETLSFNNQHGVYRGGSAELLGRLEARQVDRSACGEVWRIVVNAYRDNEQKLLQLPDWVVCLPGSTELLESVFGSYKAMQRHHNRGTFTTLLAALPTLVHRFSAESIRDQFARVSNKDLRAWLKEKDLLNSTQSRRVAAYAAA